MQDGRSNLGGTASASTGVYVGCVWQEYQVLTFAIFCYCFFGNPFHISDLRPLTIYCLI